MFGGILIIFLTSKKVTSLSSFLVFLGLDLIKGPLADAWIGAFSTIGLATCGRSETSFRAIFGALIWTYQLQSKTYL
jgi:hypothetical protein